MILYGAPVREEIKKRLIERVKKLDFKPFLVIVQVGDREDSSIYIRQKQKFGEEIGVGVVLKNFKHQISNIKLEEEIKKLMLKERFQEEHKGFDFSDAQINGNVPNAKDFMGGLKYS